MKRSILLAIVFLTALLPAAYPKQPSKTEIPTQKLSRDLSKAYSIAPPRVQTNSEGDLGVTVVSTRLVNLSDAQLRSRARNMAKFALKRYRDAAPVKNVSINFVPNLHSRNAIRAKGYQFGIHELK